MAQWWGEMDWGRGFPNSLLCREEPGHSFHCNISPRGHLVLCSSDSIHLSAASGGTFFHFLFVNVGFLLCCYWVTSAFQNPLGIKPSWSQAETFSFYSFSGREGCGAFVFRRVYFWIISGWIPEAVLSWKGLWCPITWRGQHNPYCNQCEDTLCLVMYSKKEGFTSKPKIQFITSIGICMPCCLF